ncbi:c-type cytochrome [Roseibium sp. SCP14]|uniref:c-type cytochrome n=1 Tax=Roseibium sp. SCP14 TaxID=3141375 RepID=UPI0033399F18
MTVSCRILAGMLVLPFMLANAQADGNSIETEIGPCLACHSLDANKTGLPGPNLADLKGRRLGGDLDFGYSPVLKEAFEGGDVWTEDLLDRFLADPEGMFPGMWMSYPGIEEPETREALVEFILRGETIR